MMSSIDIDDDGSKRVKEIMEKWLEPLGLAHWRIDVLWIDEKLKNDDGDDVAFRINVLPQYMSAEIRAYAPTLFSLTDQVLEEYVVHELMHIFLSELEHEQDDYHWHAERICTMLAKAFRWVWKAGNESLDQH